MSSRLRPPFPAGCRARWRARLGSVLVVLAISLPAVAVTAPLPSAAADTCDGVWVVVDAREAGGTLSTRCVPGDPGSGLAALEAAGHRTSFVPRSPGMVCTIDARPDPCNGAPSDAYWSYWHAPAGGSWTYATLGAGSRDPAPGSVEGWRFGDGDTPPGTDPPADAPPPADPPPAGSPDSPDTSDDTPTAEDPPPADTEPPAEPTTDPDPPTEDPPPADQPTTPEPATPEPATPEPATPEPATPEPATPERSAPPERDDTGERSEAPPAATAPPGVDAEEPDDPAPEDGTAPVVTSRQLERSSSERPIGAIVGTGLLAGIGALTWRQRRRHDGTAA